MCDMSSDKNHQSTAGYVSPTTNPSDDLNVSPLSRGLIVGNSHFNSNARSYAPHFSSDVTPPHDVSSTTMSGCTWHTVSEGEWPSYRPLSISQHLPPHAPQQHALTPLQQQIHQVMSQHEGVQVDISAVSHVTDVLINTVTGINLLKRSLGDHVVASLVALVLKDVSPAVTQHPPGWSEQPSWEFKPSQPQGSPLLSNSNAADLLPVGLLE